MYRPNTGFSGEDSFTFYATNGRANSEVATFQINVFKVDLAMTGVAADKKLTVGGFVPVDADRFGPRAEGENAIPKVRNLTRQKVPNDIPELVRVNVSVSPLALTGVYLLTYQNRGDAVIRLWDNARKNKEIQSGSVFTWVTLPQSFYVEGVNPSVTGRDSIITLAYLDFINGPRVSFDQVAVTVTPIVNNFTIKPGNVGLLFNGQVFEGVGVNAPNLTKFDATVFKKEARGQVGFIQNITVVNHLRRTAASFVFINNDRVNYDLKFNDVTYPILDAFRYSPPFYQTKKFTRTSAGDSQTIKDADGPLTGNPNLDVRNYQTIDLQYKYTMYLMWIYPSGAAYTLAAYDWDVMFEGEKNAQGVFVVRADSKVNVDASAVLTHANPVTTNKRRLTFNKLITFVPG